MAREIINTGTVANDGTGDPVRNAFVKVNNMTSELYTALGDGSLLNAYVAATGAPVNTQIAIWVDGSQVEGSAQLTFNTASNTMLINGSTPTLQFTDTGDLGTYEIFTNASGLTISADTDSLDASTFISLEVDGSSALYITDTLDIGLGTPTPSVRLDVDGQIRTREVLVGALPTALSAGAGARAFVTDANAATFGTVAVGGGVNAVPVYSDGTDWRIG